MDQAENIKGIKFSELTAAINWSNTQLGTPRLKRLEAIKQYVGTHYADDGSDRRVPTNFIELAVTIYSRLLAARAPRVMFKALNPALSPFAKTTEIALNQIPDEIGLGTTLSNSVIDALFCCAAVKVGLEVTDKQKLGVNLTEPYASLISIDDYFCDMSAKTRDQMQFEGNDYWRELDYVKTRYDVNLEGDEFTVIGENGDERAEEISTNEGADIYQKRVWLRDVWLPGSRQMVTYAVKSLAILSIVDWDGPEHGPYHMLGFSPVPGNLLPLPPVALWRDLHELANNIFRKVAKQAVDKKTVIAFAGNNDDDAKRLREATDGEGIHYSGQKPEKIDVGGIDASALAVFLQSKDLFSWFAGNLDSLGGLGVSSDTVGQDKLLSEAASARLNFMSDQVYDFTKSIFKSLAWYEWTNPVRSRKVRKTIDGTDIGVNATWDDTTVEGDWLDYNFDIDVFSMKDDSPSGKLQKINAAMTNFILPIMPFLQQQGGGIDGQKFIELISEYSNIPELKNIITFQTPSQSNPIEENPEPASGMPANTTRTYERVNRPGATRHGKDDVFSRLLMNGNVQGAEGAALTREVS